jgi:hypothetical protein
MASKNKHTLSRVARATKQKHKKARPLAFLKQPRLAKTGYYDTIVTDVFYFPQSIHMNATIVPRLGHDLFPPNTFKFIIHQSLPECLNLIAVWHSSSSNS